jgi:cold shock CspA family protein
MSGSFGGGCMGIKMRKEFFEIPLPPSAGALSRAKIRSSQRLKGTVKWYNEKRHFGFLVPDDPAESELFFHITGLATPDHPPQAGDRVSFCVGTWNGRKLAKRIIKEG